MQSSPQHRKRRTGSNAVEFGIIAPFFIALLLGIVDWGYYFFRQSTALALIRSAARVGATTPALDSDDRSIGECADCASNAEADLQARLGRWGFQAAHIESNTGTLIDLGGGICGIQLSAVLTYPGLAGGLVPIPGHIPICATMALENDVEGCTIAPGC